MKNEKQIELPDFLTSQVNFQMMRFIHFSQLNLFLIQWQKSPKSVGYLMFRWFLAFYMAFSVCYNLYFYYTNSSHGILSKKSFERNSGVLIKI